MGRRKSRAIVARRPNQRIADHKRVAGCVATPEGSGAGLRREATQLARLLVPIPGCLGEPGRLRLVLQVQCHVEQGVVLAHALVLAARLCQQIAEIVDAAGQILFVGGGFPGLT